MCVKCNESSCSDANPICSKPGPPGPSGKDGLPGERSNTIITGVDDPLNESGFNGDVYFNFASFDVFEKESGSWVLKGNIKGPQGDQGLTGSQGLTGNAGTNGTNGTNGSDGTNGNNFLQGSADPTAAIGVDGDSYLNNQSLDIFLKSGGSWSLTGNIGLLAGGGYLFLAAKTNIQQVAQGTPNVKITFSDDSTGGNFDSGALFNGDTYVFDDTRSGMTFSAQINLEIVNLPANAGSNATQNLVVSVIKNVGGTETVLASTGISISETADSVGQIKTGVLTATGVSGNATDQVYYAFTLIQGATGTSAVDGAYQTVPGSIAYNNQV